MIEKFLLEICIKYQNIGLKVNLLLFITDRHSNISNHFKRIRNLSIRKKAMNFFNTLESTLVNGDIPFKYQ